VNGRMSAAGGAKARGRVEPRAPQCETLPTLAPD
jgi:hypothetical protein